MILRRRNKVPDARLAQGSGWNGPESIDGLDAARRMALDGLAKAFEAAEVGKDWFAVRTELKRVDDAVQAVWYAARVRDDGRR